jgi:hypothetical protein
MRNIASIFLGLILAAYTALALAIPFAPASNTATSTHTCTNASSRVAVAVTITGQTQIELQNAGTATTFWATGDVTVTASAASYPVFAGHSKLITVTTGVTHIACFASSGSHTGYATIGLGES